MKQIQLQKPFIDSPELKPSQKASASTELFIKLDEQLTAIQQTIYLNLAEYLHQDVAKAYHQLLSSELELLRKQTERLGKLYEFSVSLPSDDKSQISSSKSLMADKFKKDVSTYMELESELMKNPEYRGKYVVIHDGKIVASGNDKKKLLSEAYAKFGYVPLVIHRVGEKRVIHHYSPHRR